MLAGSAVLALLVWVLLWVGWRRGGDGSARKRLWVVWLGLVMPGIVLTALVVYALILGGRMLPTPAPDAVAVTARASQYAWDFGHPGGRATRGTLHIPAGRPVDVTITATDVIHAFWVPRLGGKIDAIPGHTNVLRIRADAPGRYQGVCAEYCGVGHRDHGFVVIAHDPAGWAAIIGGAS